MKTVKLNNFVPKLNYNQKNKKLSLRLKAVAFLLLAMASYSFFYILPLSWRQTFPAAKRLVAGQVVLALSGNYNKNVGDQLTSADWNLLDDDFLAKSGGTMSGPLNLGGQRISNLPYPAAASDIATKQYVDDAVVAASASAQVKDLSGNNLKVVCGNSPKGNTNWTWATSPADNKTITVTVDTSAAGFSSTPIYHITSLGGNSQLYPTKGVNSIISPQSNSFRLNIIFPVSPGVNLPALAKSTYQWFINWCAYGR